MDPGRRPLTPHRRQHWRVEQDAEPDLAQGDLRSPDEVRLDAKRLLWRDSAIILVGIVLALLAATFVPGLAPALIVDETSPPSGRGAGAPSATGSAAPVAPTLGPVVNPSLDLDATPRPVPPVTQPPTGTSRPSRTPQPAPKPTKPPPASIPPASPDPTAPVPTATPSPTPSASPTPSPADTPPPTVPPETSSPPSSTEPSP